MKSCCSASSPCNIETNDWDVSIVWKLAIAAIVAGQSMMWGIGLNLTELASSSTAYWWLHGILIASALVVTILLGKPLLINTWRSIQQNNITIEALFMISLLGALGGSLISTFRGYGPIYYEVISIVFIIYTLGNTLSKHSRTKALKAANAVKEQFDFAFIGTERKQISIDDLHLGDTVSVLPGEAISVDGIILEGCSFVQETALTGEPSETVKRPGDRVLAGTYAVDGKFEIQTTALRGDRKLDTILQAVTSAQETPSRLQAQADKITHWFVPCVLTICLGTFAYWKLHSSTMNALFNSMSVLLVACPCALGLATPIAIWSGLWKLSTLGIVSKRGSFIDQLARTKHIIFDKTGTLSEESLILTDWVINKELDRDLVKTLTAAVERSSNHPIARAFQDFDPDISIKDYTVLQSNTAPGQGILAKVQDTKDIQYDVQIGSLSLMPANTHDALLALASESRAESKKPVYIAINGAPAGVGLLSEALRPSAKTVFQALKEKDLKINILTGDPNPTWSSIEGVELQSNLTPDNKSEAIHKIKSEHQNILFVGDGINDTPAMHHADASIAMGSGASLTRSSASAVLINNDLSSIPPAIDLAKNVQSKIRGNLYFAITYNLAGMGFAAAGKLNPIIAAVIMLASSLFVSIRAVRSTQL